MTRRLVIPVVVAATIVAVLWAAPAVQAQDPAELPPVVTGPVATGLTFARIEWRSVDGADGYEVQWYNASRESGFPAANFRVVKTLSITLTPLESDSVYLVRIRPMRSAGSPGPWARVVADNTRLAARPTATPAPTPRPTFQPPGVTVARTITAGADPRNSSRRGYGADFGGTGAYGLIDDNTLEYGGETYTIEAIKCCQDYLTLEITPCLGEGVVQSVAVDNAVYTISYRACWVSRGSPLSRWQNQDDSRSANLFTDGQDHAIAITLKNPTPATRIGLGAGQPRHEGQTLRDTLCALPSRLGDGICAPVVVFLAPLFLVGLMFGVGLRQPLVLAVVGLGMMAGMGAIVMPGPILIVVFGLAAAGLVALLIMLRR